MASLPLRAVAMSRGDPQPLQSRPPMLEQSQQRELTQQSHSNAAPACAEAAAAASNAAAPLSRHARLGQRASGAVGPASLSTASASSSPASSSASTSPGPPTTRPAAARSKRISPDPPSHALKSSSAEGLHVMDLPSSPAGRAPSGLSPLSDYVPSSASDDSLSSDDTAPRGQAATATGSSALAGSVASPHISPSVITDSPESPFPRQRGPSKPGGVRKRIIIRTDDEDDEESRGPAPEKQTSPESCNEDAERDEDSDGINRPTPVSPTTQSAPQVMRTGAAVQSVPAKVRDQDDSADQHDVALPRNNRPLSAAEALRLRAQNVDDGIRKAAAFRSTAAAWPSSAVASTTAREPARLSQPPPRATASSAESVACGWSSESFCLWFRVTQLSSRPRRPPQSRLPGVRAVPDGRCRPSCGFVLCAGACVAPSGVSLHRCAEWIGAQSDRVEPAAHRRSAPRVASQSPISQRTRVDTARRRSFECSRC